LLEYLRAYILTQISDTSIEDNSTRELIASRVALEFKDGDYVNLGIGIPDYSVNFIPEGVDILIHSENGILGMGPDSPPGQEDPDVLNASKEAITYVKGSSLFSSSDSFGIIRGGHLDLSILGALQVSQTGDLANWCIPGKMMKGIGGAMDLVAGVKRIVVATSHVTKDGKPKIVKSCTLPLTGGRVVDTIITDLAVFQVKKDGSGLLLTEYAPHTTVEEIRAKTEADFEVSPNLKFIKYSPMKSTETEPWDAHAAASPCQLKSLYGLYELLKANNEFKAALKEAVKTAGSPISPNVLSVVAKQNPDLVRAVKSNQNKFMRMIENM
jgi:3-oxoacid CoA-transferase subunit B